MEPLPDKKNKFSDQFLKVLGSGGQRDSPESQAAKRSQTKPGKGPRKSDVCPKAFQNRCGNFLNCVDVDHSQLCESSAASHGSLQEAHEAPTGPIGDP